MPYLSFESLSNLASMSLIVSFLDFSRLTNISLYDQVLASISYLIFSFMLIACSLTSAALVFQVYTREENQYVIQTSSAVTIGAKDLSEALISVLKILAAS
jgi:hypothetical protein